MTNWKNKAFETFPELRTSLQENKKSLYLYFYDLMSFAGKSLDRGADGIADVRRVLDFIKWVIIDCPRGANAANDAFTIAMTSFIENLPQNRKVLDYAKRYWPKDFRIAIADAIMYHGTDDDKNEFIL